MLWTSLCGLQGTVLSDSVLLQAHYSAHGMHKCVVPLCIGAFRIIIFLRNGRLLIAFLVHLICHMMLPHYCAVRLKEMYLNFTVYIFIYKYITCFPLLYFKQYKEQYIIFTRFSPTLIHFSLFHNKCFFSLILDLIKLCTHDFSRVTFATELSTNLVYKIFLS